MLDAALGWFEDGGPIVWLLAVVSLYSLALIALKLVELLPVLAGRDRRQAAIGAWRNGDTQDARAKVSGGGTPADRLLAVAMDALSTGPETRELERELERRGNEELERLRGQLRTLEVIAMVSPLLGLLGTVLGMIQ